MSVEVEFLVRDYRVSFNSLRTLWALLNIKNEGKCSSKSYRFKEEGCDFHSQLLFFSYVEANVFYSPWHLKLLKHEISSWSYICPSVKKNQHTRGGVLTHKKMFIAYLFITRPRFSTECRISRKILFLVP
jgi:hypothetical protein